jgi:hypothetical protein
VHTDSTVTISGMSSTQRVLVLDRETRTIEWTGFNAAQACIARFPCTGIDLACMLRNWQRVSWTVKNYVCACADCHRSFLRY